MDAGKLVTDELVIALVKERITRKIAVTVSCSTASRAPFRKLTP